MKLVDRIESKIDNVVKYVFKRWDSHVIEFSYIDNGTNKDIICVSVANMCALGCKFCHCTDYIGKVPVYSISNTDISFGVSTIVSDIKSKKDTLLISYMGCGDPLNMAFDNSLINSMLSIRGNMKDKYKTVRFGIATCLPNNRVDRFFKFCQDVKLHNLPVKLHLSLHYTKDFHRNKWMPSALDIKPSIAACNWYRQYTGNDVEIHYTLIKGVNDRSQDMTRLARLLRGTDFNIKIITYNEKETLDWKAYDEPEFWKYWLTNEFGPFGNTVEIYTPPGRDIGASCGQFIFNDHIKYTK